MRVQKGCLCWTNKQTMNPALSGCLYFSLFFISAGCQPCSTWKEKSIKLVKPSPAVFTSILDIYSHSQSICKHASLLQCLFYLSCTFTPLLIPLSIYHVLLSSSRASWPCPNETPVKQTQAQQEMFFPNIMWFNPFAPPEITTAESGCCKFCPLAHGAKQTSVLTSPLSLLSGPKSLTWTNDLSPFAETLLARGLNEPENQSSSSIFLSVSDGFGSSPFSQFFPMVQNNLIPAPKNIHGD